MRVDGRRTNLNLGISTDVVGAELWCGEALEGESCQLLSPSLALGVPRPLQSHQGTLFV